MSDFLAVMAWPFLACLVLTGIHAYLGLHVIERQVIFVDLALAQIAALGTACALLAGADPQDPVSYGLSVAFAVGGAALFSATRFRRQVIPQEAVIGIVYAVAAAALVLVLSRHGEGDEHIRHSLIGNVLLVRPGQVVELVLLYGAVGIFHAALRKPFLLISRDPAAAFARGVNVRLYDFLFYASFGLVVTSSVRIAGVLLVFSFLVVPAAAAVLFYKETGPRLIFGWAFGALVSAAGMAASYFWDLPTGASVVCAFGLALLAGCASRLAAGKGG